MKGIEFKFQRRWQDSFPSFTLKSIQSEFKKDPSIENSFRPMGGLYWLTYLP